ncbi:hypothetical protein [Streptomyces sp. RP5T]|nr:hypothetical protein [Streptomyces sp. RP5T]
MTTASELVAAGFGIDAQATVIHRTDYLGHGRETLLPRDHRP